jgi:hypothetical protein
MITKLIFNAELQRESIHELSAAPNGEVVATCTETGRILKFPANISKVDFEARLAEHKEANIGQVTQASIDAKLAELGDDPKDEELVKDSY